MADQIDFRYEVRDPVAGLIRLTELEWRVLDTPPMQRLRRISQLALADLVYPGCVHNRFLHSLGTMAMADRIWCRLAERRDLLPEEIGDRQLVRLAALLHDVGHGPYSHVSEYLLDAHADPGELPRGQATHKIHELVTRDIIERDTSLVRVIRPELRMEVVNLLAPPAQITSRDFRRDIVSSALDADKIDYLARDSHFAGVAYGQFDRDKVIDASVVRRTGGESYLAIAEEGRYAVEQMILCKWHMTQQVYAHRVRVITDAMIVRGLELAIDGGNAPVGRLYRYRRGGDFDFVEHYLRYDDFTLMREIIDGPESEAGSRAIFQRLRERRLFKELLELPVNELDVPNADERTTLTALREDQDAMRQKESEIAGALGCEPWEVVVLPKETRNPAYSDRERIDPEEIHVVAPNGQLRTLRQYGRRDLPLMESDWGAAHRIHVVAPADTYEDGAAARTALAHKIREILVAPAGGSA